MSTEDVTVLPLDPDLLVLVVDDELIPRSIIARMVRSLRVKEAILDGEVVAPDPAIEAAEDPHRGYL